MANKDNIDTGIERSSNVADNNELDGSEIAWADNLAYNGPTADNQLATFKQNFATLGGPPSGDREKKPNLIQRVLNWLTGGNTKKEPQKGNIELGEMTAEVISDVWNGPFSRMLVPDKISFT